jgi:polyhydroxybutyrate depolymerase
MLRRALVGVAVVLALLAGAAAYLLYAPMPPMPHAPIASETLDIGGYTRRYLVYTPSHFRPGASVLIALHPSMSNADAMRRLVGRTFERIADRDNVVVVYPDAYDAHFNDCRLGADFTARKLNIDDVAFVKRVIERLVAAKNIDPRRVFALGFSNGGELALRLALEAPDSVKGVASIAANMPAPNNMACKVSPHPSRFVVFVAGTEDPISPYGGGPEAMFGFGDRGDVLSAQESAEWFAKSLGAAAVKSEAEPAVSGPYASEQDWISPDAHVRLVTIHGGGHTVPQAGYRFPRILGGTLLSNSVLESTWRLFSTGH